MVDQKIDSNDHLQQYCRMLGHNVPFEYCRSMNISLPCRNTLSCWKNIFPVNKFVSQHYSKEEIAIFLQPPKAKLDHIYEVMIKAQKKLQKK